MTSAPDSISGITETSHQLFSILSHTVLFFFTLGIQLLGSIYYGAWHVLLWFLLLVSNLANTLDATMEFLS